MSHSFLTSWPYKPVKTCSTMFWHNTDCSKNLIRGCAWSTIGEGSRTEAGHYLAQNPPLPCPPTTFVLRWPCVSHQNILSKTILQSTLGDPVSHTTTACLKPFFRAPWRVGKAMVSRENAGWTRSKSGHPCPWQSSLQEPPAKKELDEDLCWIVPQIPTTTQSVKGLNCTDPVQLTEC